ncbi:late blight resistance homolog R1A-10 [Olea europaea subsp. europaea]|uniref:Late blight resistance homolog R1A-10 n=1 Tax=Olea europaea subsp. europaea TaxID=158383 RepID=A0A8S0S6Z9_OLEEU|nr:late blight resistance homolog R1A-10 [Olea europaea subsp. europaea]
MDLSYQNLSLLVTNPDILYHLKDLKLDGGEKIVSFQWVGPHFLTFLKYQTEESKHDPDFDSNHDTFDDLLKHLHDLDCKRNRFRVLLKRLDDSASDCILYGEIERYKNFLDIVLSFMPQIREFFTLQSLMQLFVNDDYCVRSRESFISFIPEVIGELLNYRMDSPVLVSNQVKVLLKELNFLLNFLLDTVQIRKHEQTENILTEIEAVFNKAGLFLHSFFFTTDIVTATKMDLAVSVLLERVEIVKPKIKNCCIAVLKKLNRAEVEIDVPLRNSEVQTCEVRASQSELSEDMTTKIINGCCIAVSMSPNREIGRPEVAASLRPMIENILEPFRKELRLRISMELKRIFKSQQVAARPIELSSNILMGEEMIVGFKDVATQIVSKLVGGPKYRQIISIVGMGGLGKTTIAKIIYSHSNVMYHFDKLSWCVVSQTHQKRKLLIDCLSSTSTINRDQISEMEDEELAELLYKSLKGRRYLIIMDDLWDKEAWNELKRLFPEDTNGSRVLFTSRLNNLAEEISHFIIKPPLLSPRESWNLLKQKVFQKEHCPQELQVIGMQIAENCHGLPLSIIMIAGVLSNMEKKESLWQQVAESFSSYISQKVDDYIPTLKLSYMHLPNRLKPCFLYLSAFHEDEIIPVCKLLSLWIAEGFIEKKEQMSLEDIAEEYLLELIDRSLLQVANIRSDNRVKECTLHDLVLDMCCKVAEEDENFLFQHQFLVSKHLHRLCMDRSHRLSEALSVLYDSEKIKILIARNDRMVRLGIKIMPHLRYLDTPLIVPSIGRLQNLEVLRLQDTCRDNIPPYLLNMPKLRHIYLQKSIFAKFSEKCDNSLTNSLQTLCNICIYDSKDEEILKCSPNLRKLTCKCPVYFLPDLSFFSQLDSLKITYERRFEGDYLVVNFPRSIRKLTLCGAGLPFEKMSIIGTLPNLEILILENEAFEGRVWDTGDDEFQKLKYLELRHLSFEQWNSSYDHFPVLEQLVLDFCTNLETIPSDFGNIPTLQIIAVCCCGKNVESSAMEIREEQRDSGNDEFEVIA